MLNCEIYSKCIKLKMGVFPSKVKSVLVRNGKALGVELPRKSDVEKTSAGADLLVFSLLQITAFSVLPRRQECCGSRRIAPCSFRYCAAPKQVEHV